MLSINTAFIELDRAGGGSRLFYVILGVAAGRLPLHLRAVGAASCFPESDAMIERPTSPVGPPHVLVVVVGWTLTWCCATVALHICSVIGIRPASCRHRVIGGGLLGGKGGVLLGVMMVSLRAGAVSAV